MAEFTLIPYATGRFVLVFGFSSDHETIVKLTDAEALALAAQLTRITCGRVGTAADLGLEEQS